MNTTKVMLRVLVFSLVFTMLSTHQALGNKENCDKDKDFIKRQCERCIGVGRKFPTTKLCCNAIKRADMACVCRSITLEEQLTISVMKVVDVAKECGNPVPPGNKCGTWTVPPQLLARVHP
ncbi:Putative bifunctional inhibitor/lipid-transfer protein/seed storage 2S albumin superfamily protein [Zea mays]|uniref:Putative bifunctional inhibitor/lipid-transfer protein/seed storage 2S albumin superfamily protein n=1 Tax=Zea mays TaxID=4577 RepID=K7TJ50_MAIZE|nr:Putative bifunctional inhibitor/lipid-transfer protein/seed storage 2S albumin superfamily protein [Zea mays]